MRKPVRLDTLPSLDTLPADGLLTTEETASYLGVSPSTLEKWRMGYRGVHGGPPHLKLHDGKKGAIRFMVSDVRAWLDQRRHTSEGGQTPAQTA